MSNIPIKNIYYMLSYAFSFIKESSFERLSVESFENIHDLFAAILSLGISTQLKQGLYREYVSKIEDLSVVRGKIHMRGTIRNRLAKLQRVSCAFDELSENNLLNQIIKTTVFLLIKSPCVKLPRKKDLRQRMLFFSDVEALAPHSINWSLVRFQRNNNTYRILVSLCKFILDEMLLTNERGEHKLSSFIDEQKMHRLYEKFILEYYRKHYPELKANSPQIQWAVDECSDLTWLPSMQSDIMLSYGKNILIIDAKYYVKNMTMRYSNQQKLHSGNLYQIFTYVKNMQAEAIDCNVSGLLLYAQTKDDVQPNAECIMQGNKISAKTLDLSLPFAKIAAQLNKIADCVKIC
jgi:5-methylcytosine-specific restriction enzyme subunit McrC